MELIERVTSSWKGIMIGWWWASLGQVYSSCLVSPRAVLLSVQGSSLLTLPFLQVLLANRIVDRAQPDAASSDAQGDATRNLRRAYDFLIELGWESSKGVAVDGSKDDVRFPPESVRSTARRCYRILLGIDRCLKSPKASREVELQQQDDEALDKGSLRNRDPSVSKSDSSSKTNRTAGGTAVPPSRYARRPDPSIPPLRLTGATTNAFE